MAVDTALFVLGLDTVGIPDTIAITLLTSNSYKIGSATKTFSDCFTTDFTPNDSATVAIVANEGLSIDFTGGGVATSASATLTATAALEAAINPEIGATGVIDVTAVFSDPSEEVIIGLFFPANINFGNVGFGILSKGGGGMEIAIKDASLGGTVLTIAVPTVVSGQRYRMAFSITPNLLTLSANGSNAVSRVPTKTLDFSAASLTLFAGIFNARVGSSARIGDARFYPLQTDLNILKRMSA